ncbi:J domain-containing protein [Pseudomonas syringae]|uniref:J domain-containing protein n=1 Tax=Pseudomonas syringae TaxID=317 RepID=UPI001786FA7C|nr:J domain-containing protein [Pseudomonas syringae]
MFGYLYYYNVLGRGEVILAIPSPAYGNTSHELDALYDQGFVYLTQVQARNPLQAVEDFKEYESREISKLRSEIRLLQSAFDDLQRENNTLKRNSYSSNAPKDMVKNYEVFGFSTPPNSDELKKRYRSLCQKLHPDKVGDEQLFKLIQKLYGDLKETL